jgi:beta-lactam-binding protein with PASTA domain
VPIRSGEITKPTQVIAAASPGGRRLRSWLLALCVVVVGGVVGAGLAVWRNNERSEAPAPRVSTIRAAPKSAALAPAVHRNESQAAAGLTVPDVRGKKLPDARKQLRDLGLVAEVTRASSTLPKQTVVQQSPATGATAERGDHVVLTVSDGAKKDDKGNGHHRGRGKHKED